jgi:quercetin dioxygenase-like cupin family protein
MTSRPQAVATVRIETDRVKATEYAFVPGAETGWHVHAHDYVIVPLTDGRLLLEEPGGNQRRAELRLGVPYSRNAGVEHNVINDGGGELRFLEVEILR